MENVSVSIIMPVYNAGAMVSESIDSVLAQTYKSWELIIVDDKSNDEITHSILEHYQEIDSRIRVIYLKENKGPGGARNRGIEAAQGRYIAFCDSDDRWFPDKLEKQMAFIREKKCCLVYSSYILCNEDGVNNGIFIAPRIITYGGMKRDDKIGFLTAMYDTSLYGKFYFPPFRNREDWAMLILLLKECRVAYGLKEPLAYYRIRSNSLSSNKRSLVKFYIDVYHTILGFSVVKSYLYFGCLFLPTYSIKVIKKKIDSWRYLRSLHRKE